MAAKKIQIERKGRKCQYPGCKSELSVYNHNTFCHADLNKLARKSEWRVHGPEAELTVQ